MNIEELQQKIELLEIKLQHVTNDYLLTKDEFEEASRNYFEIVRELREKNKKLQDLQRNLEKIVKQRTKELQESQKTLRIKSEEQQIMLDASPAMIFYTDREHRFVRVNKSFAKFVSMPIREIIGQKVEDIFPNEAQTFCGANLEVLETGKAKHSTLEQVEMPGGIRWILIDRIPSPDLKGNIIGVIGFALDITERKRLEEQLIQSEKLATVGQLVAGVAHELNNPLAIISGYSELLRDLPYLEPEDQIKLDKIIQGAERCSVIVENLLRFSRKSRLNKTNIQVNEIISDAVAMIKHSLNVENISIMMDLSSLPQTVGDPNQLQTVFINLINNARDAIHTVKSKGWITIRSLIRNGSIVIEIADNGPGIPADCRSKIFDPFFSTKEVGKGTGLGLSLCYGIINEHKGTIYLDNLYTDGAKFVMTLPVVEPLEEQVVEKAKQELPESARFLLIEDEEDILAMQQRLLEVNLNYHIDCVESGEEALRLIEKNDYKYDVIISDMKMPGELNGEDVYWKVLGRNENLAKRIIFITGDISNTTLEFIAANNLLSIRKPFKIDEFYEVICEGFARLGTAVK